VHTRTSRRPFPDELVSLLAELGDLGEGTCGFLELRGTTRRSAW
jgi:hypothetical protein